MNAPDMIANISQTSRESVETLRATSAQFEQSFNEEFKVPLNCERPADPEVTADRAIDAAEDAIRKLPDSSPYKTHALIIFCAALINMLEDSADEDVRELGAPARVLLSQIEQFDYTEARK